VSQRVCASAELPPGEMMGTRLGELPVVVIRELDGSLRAFVDRCLHQGARLSRGRLLGAVDSAGPGDYRLVDGQLVVKCPWHGFEYDVASGCVTFDRRRRLRTVAVREEGGQVVIERR
jgi:nitrite reductase (NADH) small subunit